MNSGPNEQVMRTTEKRSPQASDCPTQGNRDICKLGWEGSQLHWRRANGILGDSDRIGFEVAARLGYDL